MEEDFFLGKPQAFWPDDLLNAEFIETKKLVDPIMPMHSNGILFGATTAGKTQLALSLTAAVTEGGLFLSKYKCRKSRVAFLEVDAPPGEFKDKIRRYAIKHSTENFLIILNDGPLDIIQASKRKEPEEWMDKLREFKPDLLIADTLNKLHFEDEDARTTPMRIFNALRRICNHNPAILLLHHPRKPGQDGESAGIYAARGSGSWVNDIEVAMEMTKDKYDNRKVNFLKTKGAPNQATLPVELDTRHPEKLQQTLLVNITDRARARVFELAVAGWSKKKIVDQVIAEGLAGKTKAENEYKNAVADLEL